MAYPEHLENLLKGMTPQGREQFEKWLGEITPREREQFERRTKNWPSPFESAPADTCIIAFFSPGFSEDLSSWKLSLTTSGVLVQDITISRSPGYKRQELREERTVGAEFVSQILARANELDFWNLHIKSSTIMEDAASHRILIRHDDKYRDYSPHIVGYHAHNSDESALRFVELWNLIHTYAPFPAPSSE